jgi:hypothetical protein
MKSLIIDLGGYIMSGLKTTSPVIITASVGRMGGVNRPDDVEKIQRVLNKVPLSEGGPKIKLSIDRLCGPKTIKAIQEFQLHHFGWNGADGNVHPHGQTIAKLSDYNVPDKKAYMLKMKCVLEPGRDLELGREEHWFFEFREIGKTQRYIYHLTDRYKRKPLRGPLLFLGESITQICGRPANDLQTHAAEYKTYFNFGKLDKHSGSLSLSYRFQNPGEPIQVASYDFWYPAAIKATPRKSDPWIPGGTWDRGYIPKWGHFNLVRSL